MSDEIENSENEEQQPVSFSREYVQELRAEAAENRIKAKQVDTLRDAYRTAVLKEASRNLLAEPLVWDDAYDGEDGMPDTERIREAAQALALEKPHLARVAPSIPQGPQGDDTDTVSLAGMLRAGA